eukprot:scaffold7329_cov117-Cylindrotheca_fusiformis.AAC.2
MEGVSLIPSKKWLNKWEASGGAACGVLLTVSNEEAHRSLLKHRGFQTGQTSNEEKKLNSFDRVRLIQDEMKVGYTPRSQHLHHIGTQQPGMGRHAEMVGVLSYSAHCLRPSKRSITRTHLHGFRDGVSNLWEELLETRKDEHKDVPSLDGYKSNSLEA